MIAAKEEINRLIQTALWLTYQNQLNHYKKVEDYFVEEDFARRPVDDDERDQCGHVIFFEEKLGDIMNYDEMKFSLCGKGQERSGRPAKVPINNSLPNEAFDREEEFFRTRVNLLPKHRVKNILAAIDIETLKEVVAARDNQDA